MRIYSVIPLYTVTVDSKEMKVLDMVNCQNSGIQSSLCTSEEEVDNAIKDYYVVTSVSS